ncbi:MAG: hypothetical protein CVV27_07725 [Candidatus Melainabacteria bacterium HGW-Melainabacteria-1]|nr:MAG: hypothetical protein CVV27_07725 [Candidatus Melainabacteria bacterium HGW-Melainabacteria-1]
MSQLPFKDLTDLVNQAHRGLKRDVAPLVEALPEGGFFLSLARSLGLPNDLTPPPPEAAVSSHMLQHPDGTVYVSLFTRPEYARLAQQEQSWQTEDGKQEVCPLPARNALYYAWKLLEGNEQVVGLFINAYQEKSVLINRLELESFFNGVAIPLEAYATQVPFEADDSILVRPADVTGVENFKETVQQFMEQNSGVTGYEVVALFDEQRNMQPYLAINLKTEFGEDKYAETAQNFVTLMSEKVTMPERLEIMFNENFPGLI